MLLMKQLNIERDRERDILGVKAAAGKRADGVLYSSTSHHWEGWNAPPPGADEEEPSDEEEMKKKKRKKKDDKEG